MSKQKPQVSTLAADDITATSAILHGKVDDKGRPSYTEKGFCYSTSVPNPTIDENKKVVSGTGVGAFSANLSGLTTSSTYYVRAYATNSEGTAYGQSISFNPGQKPQVSTLPVDNIKATSVTLHGNIDDRGRPSYTEKGFCYSTTFQNPTIDENKKVVSGTGVGAFSANLSELTTGTTYYVRAYATNSEGTAYGQSISFKPESPYYVVLATAGLMVQKTDITGSQGSWDTGNSLCENSTLAGYTDWRLPTKDELATMYNERNNIGGFKTTGSYTIYWSSSPFSSLSRYYQDFSNGNQWYVASGSNHCRCIRSLP
jgi:hypothetical protein